MSQPIKVVVHFQAKAHILQENGMMKTPAIADGGSKIICLNCTSEEDAKTKIQELYEKVLPCLS